MIWLALAATGFVLLNWASLVNPDANRSPDHVPTHPTTYRGPYRFLRHPIYDGSLLLIVGLVGWGSNWKVALGVGILAELLFRDWKEREARH